MLLHNIKCTSAGTLSRKSGRPRSACRPPSLFRHKPEKENRAWPQWAQRAPPDTESSSAGPAETKLPAKFLAVSPRPFSMPSPSKYPSHRFTDSRLQMTVNKLPFITASTLPSYHISNCHLPSVTRHLPHRSTSPSTISTLPKISTTSATLLPRHMSSSTVRLIQARRANPIAIRIRSSIADEIKSPARQLGRFDAAVGLARLGPKAAQLGLRIHDRTARNLLQRLVDDAKGLTHLQQSNHEAGRRCRHGRPVVPGT